MWIERHSLIVEFGKVVYLKRQTERTSVSLKNNDFERQTVVWAKKGGEKAKRLLVSYIYMLSTCSVRNNAAHCGTHLEETPRGLL